MRVRKCPVVLGALTGLAALALVVAPSWAADDPLAANEAAQAEAGQRRAAQIVDLLGEGGATDFQDGYVVLKHNLQVEDDPAGRRLCVTLDAASPDGAKLGALVGCLRVKDDGKPVWRNSRLTWDRVLAATPSTHELQYRIPDNARGPRLWIGIYRSNREGTLRVESAKIALATKDDLSDDERLVLKRIDRDWRYLQQRARQAQSRAANSDELEQVVEQVKRVRSQCLLDARKVLAEAEGLRRKYGAFSAQVNRVSASGLELAASFSEAYSRLAPDEILPDPVVSKSEVLAVPGQYSAVGVVVANGTGRSQAAALSLAGLSPAQFACQVRRQVSLETWYKRRTTRDHVADPLCLLPRVDGSWALTLEPGEIAKLYVSIHCLASGAPADATLLVKWASGQARDLVLRVEAAGRALPSSVRFGHAAFIYPLKDRTRAATAADMGAHGVNRMEFTRLPVGKFSKDGELLEADFSQHEAWLKVYGAHVEKMMIFWAPGCREGFPCVDGTSLELLSPPGRRAFVNLLRAFFERAAELGYGMERFAILPVDEVHSKALKDAPDAGVARAVAVMQLLRGAFADLEIMMTLTYYAFPKDVEAVLPYIDVAIPYLDQPTKLGRNAPPTYNPRQAFAEKTWPMLDAARAQRGMEIWSYLVAPGKSDNVLMKNRAYPLRAVGAGMTGVSMWAYNVCRGSTWDDTDGGERPGVDYVYVYDGTEDHPLCRQFNPTGEPVVPSIRWEALRAGIQDAKVLLHLRRVATLDTCADELKADIETLLKKVEGFAQDAELVTWESVGEIARQARQLYARSVRTD
jgi:hypothetical protein